MISALTLLAIRAGAQELATQDAQAGLAAWGGMASVLTHPRCLNCHTMTDYPRQGDERRPHGLMVRRGPDGHGEGPKCQACHIADDGPGSGIPSAKDWHMAPLALAWESEPGKVAPGAAICATLKRMDNDDGPDYERLIEYAQLAPFVLWAWEPGKRPDGTERSTPLLTHEEFVAALKRWISAGAPCPGEVAPTAASPAAMTPEGNAPAETVPTEPLPTEPTSPEAAPSDVPPATMAPQDDAPAEPVPAEPVPPEAAPSDAAPAVMMPEDNAPAEPVPAEPALPEAAPSDVAPAERPGGSNPSP